jgi:hypothetical protein
MHQAFYTHTTSTVLEAPIDVVWASVRDIVGLVKLLLGDAAASVAWEDGGSVDRVPAAFTFSIAGGGPPFHEIVTGRSESEHAIQYRAAAPVLSMAEYTADLRLYRVTLPADHTFAVYSRRFSLLPGADPREQLPMLTGIMDNETVALRDHFARARGSAA